MLARFARSLGRRAPPQCRALARPCCGRTGGEVRKWRRVLGGRAAGWLDVDRVRRERAAGSVTVVRHGMAGKASRCGAALLAVPGGAHGAKKARRGGRCAASRHAPRRRTSSPRQRSSASDWLAGGPEHNGRAAAPHRSRSTLLSQSTARTTGASGLHKQTQCGSECLPARARARQRDGSSKMRPPKLIASA
jgi:hypothetical protein